jgi:hypothetical protein
MIAAMEISNRCPVCAHRVARGFGFAGSARCGNCNTRLDVVRDRAWSAVGTFELVVFVGMTFVAYPLVLALAAVATVLGIAMFCYLSLRAPLVPSSAPRPTLPRR